MKLAARILLVCSLVLLNASLSFATPFSATPIENAFVPTEAKHLEKMQSVFLQLFPNYVVSAKPKCLSKRFASYNSSNFDNSESIFLKNIDKQEFVELRLINDPAPNAFALPADTAECLPATILVSTGLLYLAHNSSELAFVIAHEMAHLDADHFTPDFPLAMLTPAQLEKIAQVHVRWEYEADIAALEMLKKANFNAEAAVELLEHLVAADFHNKEDIFDHHPELHSRVSRLRIINLVSSVSHQNTCTIAFTQ